jgi:hypothetical protein
MNRLRIQYNNNKRDLLAHLFPTQVGTTYIPAAPNLSTFDLQNQNTFFFSNTQNICVSLQLRRRREFSVQTTRI